MIVKKDFINAIYQDIEMVRGDTMTFNFELQGLEGQTPDNIIFSCAEHYDDEPLFTADLSEGITLEEYDEVKDVAIYSVRIIPSKTSILDLNRYYYDLELTINEDVITLMRGRLTLLYEVTKGV
jgi:hypothetical protein